MIRQRGAIEQCCYNIRSGALSLVAADSKQQTLQVMMRSTAVEEQPGKLGFTGALAEAKGSVKTLFFNNKEQDFVKWSREIAKYMNSLRERRVLHIQRVSAVLGHGRSETMEPCAYKREGIEMVLANAVEGDLSLIHI